MDPLEDDEYRLAEPEEVTVHDAYAPPQFGTDSYGAARSAQSPETLFQELRSQQNLFLAIWSGALGSVLGAAAWGIISAVTGYQIGFVAIGVGFLAGYSVRYFGRGIDQHFGFIGAAWAVIGCVLGNLLSICIFISQENGIPFVEVLQELPYFAVPALISTSSVIDIFFYGIALYEGYRFSFRVLTPEEVNSLTTHS